MRVQTRIPKRAAAFVLRNRVWIISVGGLLAAGGLFLGTGIAMQSQAKDMMPPGTPAVREFERIEDAFGSTATVVVAVEGPSDHTMIQVAERIAGAAAQDPVVASGSRPITVEIDRDFVREWGLLLQPAEDLRPLVDRYRRTDLLSFIRGMNDSFEGEYLSGDGQEKLDSDREADEAVDIMTTVEHFVIDLREYLQSPAPTTATSLGRSLADTFTLGESYTFDPEHRMLLFSVAPTFPIEELDRATEFVQSLRAITNEAALSYPGTTVYLAGDMVQTVDEQEALSADLLIPGLLAVGLIFVLFLFSFRQVRSMLFALVTLIAGICIEIGIIALSLGELNLLTSSFAVVLIGLGIDFGIHIVSNYTDYRSEGKDSAAALAATYRKAGVAVIIGGVTTSIAFFVLMVSSNRAITQFGLVAGTGILTVLISMLVLLPALVTTFESKAPTIHPRRPVLSYGFLPKIGQAVVRRRWMVLGLAAAVTAMLAFQVPKLTFIYNALKIGPQDAPSITAQNRIVEVFALSPYPSLALVDSIDQARSLSDRLSDHRLTAEVSSIADLVAPAEEQRERLQIIGEMRSEGRRYADLTWDADQVEEFAYEVQRLEWNLIEIADLSVAGLGEGNRIQKKRDRMVREIIGAEVGEPGDEVFQKLIAAVQAPEAQTAEALNQLDAVFAPRMSENISDLVAVDRPIGVADIPDSLRRDLVAQDGSGFLVTSYPTDAVDREDLVVRYVEEVTAIDSRITGTLPISIAMSVNTLAEAQSASLYALAAIAVILLLTFRSLRYALLSLVSLAVGIVWLFGLAPVLGVSVDLVSMMVLPLIIGIGTAFSVHLIERYRVEGDIETALRYSGKAILLSALTTIIGFGSLAFAGSMAAAVSLGMLLVLGVGAGLVVTVTVLPPLLSLESKPTAFRQDSASQAVLEYTTPSEDGKENRA